MNYLLKTEPTVYSFANLEREKTTIWDGVTNPVAVKHLREMKAGERLRAIVRCAVEATALPVTAKMRAGIEDADRLADLATAI